MNNKYNKAGAQQSLIYARITSWYPLTLMAEWITTDREREMQKVCCLVVLITFTAVRSAPEWLLEKVKAMHIWTFVI